MKTVLLSLAAVAALSSAAFASSEPRCWYGQNAPACVDSQSTNATRKEAPVKSNLDQNVREFDHDRETTRPY